MRKIRKKGVSPVIATVLLVALMLILAAIIFAWARGFVKEKLEKNGQSAELTCGKIAFAANFVPNGQAVDGKIPGTLRVVNNGPIPIYGFDIKQVNGRNSLRTPFVFSVSPGETIPAKNVLLAGDMDKLELFPILLTSVKDQKLNKQYTCLNDGEKIKT